LTAAATVLATAALGGLAVAAPAPAPDAPPAAPAGGGDPEGNVFFFFDPLQGYTFEFDFFPTQTALGDLDADGSPDLVVSGRNSEGMVAIFPGVPGPAGPFGPPSFLTVGVQTNAVALHDLDGDAVLDLIIGVRSTPGRVIVLDGLGDRTFAGRRDLPVQREVADLLVRDVDADGDPDIIASGQATADLVIFRNDGAGGFSPPERHPLALAVRASPQPFWLDSGDLDGDELEELVVSQFGSGHISVLTGGAGPGPDAGPGPARRIPLGTMTELTLVDADGDGDLDIYTPVWGSPNGTLAVLENDGAAGFTRHDFPMIGFYLWAMVGADFDANGRPEALITEALTGTGSIFENFSTPGNIAFDTVQPFVVGDFPWHLLPADLDNDCDIDLVVCDIAIHRVAWFINLTPQDGCAVTDLDGDGVTGIRDAMMVLAAWGRGGGVGDIDRDGTVGPLDLLRVTAVWEISP
jgi:hypothetical protein